MVSVMRRVKCRSPGVAHVSKANYEYGSYIEKITDRKEYHRVSSASRNIERSHMFLFFFKFVFLKQNGRKFLQAEEVNKKKTRKKRNKKQEQILFINIEYSFESKISNNNVEKFLGGFANRDLLLPVFRNSFAFFRESGQILYKILTNSKTSAGVLRLFPATSTLFCHERCIILFTSKESSSLFLYFPQFSKLYYGVLLIEIFGTFLPLISSLKFHYK